MNIIKIVLALAMAVACINPVSYAEEQEVVRFYVSTDGDDKNSGSEDEPFATVFAAQEAVRKSPYRQKNKIEVIIGGGHYSFDKTLKFEYNDSGSESAPIVYKAKDGEEVFFDAGTPISSDVFEAVSNTEILNRFYPEVRDKIKCVDLEKLNVSKIDEEEMIDIHVKNENAPIMLYCGDEIMNLSRWPNEDTVLTGKVIDAGSSNGQYAGETRPGAFVYEDEHIENWKNINDVWMWGMWFWEWAPSTTPIGSLDTENNIIHTKFYSSYGFSAKKPYYYYNVLEEIDTPGEYYIDRSNKKLYFYPVNDGDLYLLLNTFNQIELDNASYITFEDITIQGTRGDGIIVNDGEKIVVDGCTVRMMCKTGVKINSGVKHEVRNSELYNLGTECINVQAGDKRFIRHAECCIENNYMHDYGKWKVQSAALTLIGVGNTAKYNLLTVSEGMAVGVSGIENIFEYNEIYDVVTNTDDAAALYCHASGHARGSIIRYNYFHSVAKRAPKSGTGCWSIYFDCFHSDKEVYGNIFKDVPGGVHINGGQYNEIKSNLFIDVDTPIWAHAFLSHGSDDFWKPLQAVEGFDRGIWKQKYPEASEKLNYNQATTYQENVVSDNIFYDSGICYLGAPAAEGVVNHYEEPYYVPEEEEEGFFKNLDELDWTIMKPVGVDNFYVPSISEIGLREEGWDD